MDFRNAEGEGEGDAELQVAHQQHEVRWCYTCASTKHLRVTCPLRKQLSVHMGRTPANIRNAGKARENVDSR